MVPLAFGLMIGAGSSIEAGGATRNQTRRHRRHVAHRRLLATTLAWTPEMAYWPLGLWFFGAAVSIGWIMGPATDSVMGAVPRRRPASPRR